MTCMYRLHYLLHSLDMYVQVTLKGLPTNPEEQDNYYKNKGPIPKFSNDYGCIQDLVSFSVNRSALGNITISLHCLEL